MLNALRLVEGVPASLFEERTGQSLAVVARGLDKAAGKGLLLADPARLAPTELGLRFLNDLQEMFLPEEGSVLGPAGVRDPDPPCPMTVHAGRFGARICVHQVMHRDGALRLA